MRINRRFCLGLVWLLVMISPVEARAQTATTFASQWSGFRGPSGMGTVNEDALPAHWSHDESLAWQTALPGSGTSSPIAYGDRIYVTTYSGYNVPGDAKGDILDLQRQLVIIDRANGEILNTISVAARQPEEPEIRDHGYAASTPVAAQEGVYVFFGKTGVIAFDHRGNERWRADVGQETHGWGSGASLLIAGDLLIVNASVESQSLIAFERGTGRQVWKVDGIRESWNTPVLVSSDVGLDQLIVARFGEVMALNPLNGDTHWTCKNDISWYIVPSVVADGERVYSFGGRSGITGIAVDLGGQGDVTGTHRVWTTRTGTNVPSPLIKEGHLYWVSQNGGIAYCCDAVSGDLKYQERVDGMGQVYASPILAGDRIFYLDRSGKTFVVAAKPEFALLSTNDLSDGTRFDASPVVDGERLLIRSGKALYCVE